MGSHNVRKWEVVTMEGQHLVATPVLDIERRRRLRRWPIHDSRAPRDSIVGGIALSFNDPVIGNDAFWDAVGAFHVLLPPYLDAKDSFTYQLDNTELVAIGTTPGADLD